MKQQKSLALQRQRRRYRVRNRLRGDRVQPRLTVARSHRNISCQLIDDTTGATLVAAGTQEQQLRGSLPYGGNRQAAEAVGKLLAERALAAGIERARFDRGSCRYHGRVAALADAARGAGLKF